MTNARKLSLAALTLLGAAPVAAAQGYQRVTPAGYDGAQPLAVDPTDDAHVVAIALSGTSTTHAVGSLVESFDRGQTWAPIAAPSATAPGRWAAAFDGTGALYVLDTLRDVTTGTPLSVRAGGAFTDVTTLPPLAGSLTPPRLGGLVAQPGHAGHLAVQLSEFDTFGNGHEKVFVSLDGGATWTERATAASSFQNTNSFVLRGIGPLGGTESLVLRRIEANSVDFTARLQTGALAGAGLSDLESTSWGVIDAGWSRLSPTYYSCASYDWVPFSGAPRAIRRHDAGGTIAVGDAGHFVGVACGNLDTDLVVRLAAADAFTQAAESVDVSRDGGATWTTVATGTFHGPVRVSAVDTAVYVLGDAGGALGTDLLRIDLGAAQGTTTCAGVPNSTGSAATLEASGSAVVAADRLRLRARALPASVTTLPVVSRQPGFVPNAGGSAGTLCLGGPIGRDLAHVGTATAWGEIAYAPDLTGLPTPSGHVSALPGETWYFQVWYRDALASGGSNFTAAVAVTLQ